MSGTTTNQALRYPTSGDNIAPLETHFKNLADDVDAQLGPDMPASVVGESFAVNTIASGAGVWAALSTPLSASITNPSATRGLLVAVTWGARLVCNGGTGVQAALDVTGGVTKAGSSWGVGEQLMLGNLAMSIEIQEAAALQLLIPAAVAAVTFAVQGMRPTAAGTLQQVNYPKINLVPLRWV